MAALTIESLKKELHHAQQELAGATADRLKAQEIEGSWTTEVNSLKLLIQAREKREAASTHSSPPSDSELDDYEEATHVDDDMGDYGMDDESVPVQDSQLNHVDWIMKRIREHRRLTPPQIFRLAEEEGRSMHRNYPYTALKALVDAGKAKRDGEYYLAA